MPTLEEITAWSLDEIEAEIERRLPQGWRLNPVWVEVGYWDYAVESPLESEWKVEWLDQGVDRKVLALNAFGWIWFRDRPQPTATSRWARRQELTKEAVTQKVAQMVPDPEDLDPEAIDHLVHQTRK